MKLTTQIILVIKTRPNLLCQLGVLFLVSSILLPVAVSQVDEATGTAELQTAGNEESEIENPDANPLIADAPKLKIKNFLFGDWGGWRSKLADDGINFDVQLTQHFQSVTGGGVDKGGHYGGTLDYLVEFDLGTMGIQEGAIVKVLAESRYGKSVNSDVGSILPANADMSFPLTDKLDEDIALTITELSFTQFLSPYFGVILGKFQTLDGDPNEFASGRGCSQFMNTSLIFNPVTTLAVPYSTLGAGIVILPSPKIMISSMLLNTTDSSTTTGFSDIGDGWTWATEARFQHRLGGLPGGQNVAFIYADDNEFLNLNRSGLFLDGFLITTKEDTWAAYWSAWQYLYTPDEIPDRIDVNNGKADLRGLGVFARFGVADDNTSPIGWSFSAGLGGRGLLSGREDDSFGLGFGYTDLESDVVTGLLGIDDEAYGLEAYYNFALCRGVELTLDAQVINPALDGVDTATVLGARLNIRF